MDFKEYQKAALSFCSKKCFNHHYLDNRYLGEVGEVAGKLADRERGDVVIDTDIMYEIGDVAWVIAAKASLMKQQLCIKEEMIGLNEVTVHHLKDTNTPSVQVTILKAFAESMGFDFSECMRMNLNKLSYRKKYGKIMGNGDYR